MSLIEKINSDKISAMKSKNILNSSILSLVIANAKSIAKEKMQETASDEDVIQSIQKLKKNCLEMLELNPEHNESKMEISILESYLPCQLSEENLNKIISDYINQNNVGNGGKAVGIIMKFLKENYMNQYDPKSASSIVKNLVG